MNKWFNCSPYANCDDQIQDIKLNISIMQAKNEPLEFNLDLNMVESDHEDHEIEYEDDEFNF